LNALAIDEMINVGVTIREPYERFSLTAWLLESAIPVLVLPFTPNKNALQAQSTTSASTTLHITARAKHSTDPTVSIPQIPRSGEETCLYKEAKHGDHSKTAILELFHLELCKIVRVVCQAKRIKVLTTWIHSVKSLPSGSTV
jgi:hypothetical protein